MVYIVAWPGRSCFGFVAPLNEPHVARGVSRAVAACRGVLTSPDLGAMTWGSALRAVTALLQAKQLRPARFVVWTWSGLKCRRDVRGVASLLQAKQLRPGPVIARVLELSQALLRADASLRPSSLHDFSSMTKKDCHFVEAAEKAVIL